MAKKHIPAEAGDRGRLEVVFDKPHLLGSLFGEYDQNLVAIENRLGVYIAARGNKLQIEGEAEAAARARDVLLGLYNRIVQRSEEHMSELQSLMRLSYAVFCLKKKKITNNTQ